MTRTPLPHIALAPPVSSTPPTDTRRCPTIRDETDRGSISVYAAVVAPALFLCVMFFVNAAVRWEAWRDASDTANAAARAAAQPRPEDFSGGRIQMSSAAHSRAQQVIGASGYSGSVAINGDHVVVTVTTKVDYVFPFAPFGPDVTGTGTADLTVTGEG